LIALLIRHVSVLWSIALALLALSVISEYPFRDFLIQFINGNWTDLGSINLPEILKFPVPSFSTFWFLILFYLATDKAHIEHDNLKTTTLTIMFSLTIYINAIDAFFSVIFWFIYFPVRWWRRKQSFYKVTIKLGIQMILASLIIIPGMFLGKIDPSLSSDNSVSIYYLLVYFILPVFLMWILFYVQRIDPMELIFKFRYIYAIMFGEIVILSFSLSGILPLNIGIVENRIVQFFAHVFYYVPIIHFASRLSHETHLGPEGSIFAKKFRSILHFLFDSLSKIYLPILIVLLFAYNFSSGYRHIDNIMSKPDSSFKPNALE
jgi:hypothetical protein